MSMSQPARYIAPPKPALRVRLDKFKQFSLYEIKRDWKSRTFALIVFLIALALLWYVFAIRMPYLHTQQQQQLTPSMLEMNIEQLQTQLSQLNTTASQEALAQLEAHVVQGYAGVSKLLEESIAKASRNHLLFTYSLGQPTPLSLHYFKHLSSIQVKVRLVPLSKAPQHAWYNMMQQIHGMLAPDEKYQLLNVQVNSRKQQISQVILNLRILVHLDKGFQS